MKKSWLITFISFSLLGCSSQSVSQITTPTPSVTPTIQPTTSPTVDTSMQVDAGDVKVQVKTADFSGYQFLEETSQYGYEMALGQSVRLLSLQGTGIIYYGKTNCPWCQRALPMLVRVSNELQIPFYYVDVNKPISRTDLDAVLKLLEPILERDANGNLDFQVPEVVAVKNGNIVGHHLSLVESFILDDASKQMDDSQKQELHDIYTNLFQATM